MILLVSNFHVLSGDATARTAPNLNLKAVLKSSVSFCDGVMRGPSSQHEVMIVNKAKSTQR